MPRFHLTFWESIGNRLRRNYSLVVVLLGMTWLAKLLVHPQFARSWDEMVARAAIGPAPGPTVMAGMGLFYFLMFLLVLLTVGPGGSEPAHGGSDMDEEDFLGNEGLGLFG